MNTGSTRHIDDPTLNGAATNRHSIRFICVGTVSKCDSVDRSSLHLTLCTECYAARDFDTRARSERETFGGILENI